MSPGAGARYLGACMGNESYRKRKYMAWDKTRGRIVKA
jgi:hypothetical protein